MEPRHPLEQRHVNPASGFESSTQVAPFRQGFSPCWQCWLRLEQVRPFQPSTHRHTKSATKSTHVPLWRHGLAAQSSTSENKNKTKFIHSKICIFFFFFFFLTMHRKKEKKQLRRREKRERILTVIAGESVVTFGTNAVKRIDAVDAGTAIPARAISAVVNVYQSQRRNKNMSGYAMICGAICACV